MNKIDPSGMFADLASMSMAMSIRNTLANIQMDFGFGLLSAAQGDENSLWVGLAFGVSFPLIGMIVKRFAQSAQNVLQSGDWLWRHEGAGLGHTIERHVCKDIPYLRSRLTSVQAASTFLDLPIAERAIRDGMRQNKAAIADWIKGGMNPVTRDFRYVGTNEVIGVGVTRHNPDILELGNAKIVLRANDNGKGFFILTAYPE